MGKIIDRIVLTALCAAALYVLFAAAFGSVPLACILAFVCCALLTRRIRKPSGRLSTQDARGILTSWAFAPDEEARENAARLLKLQPDDPSLRWLPRHPSASVSTGDVFGAWKSARGTDRIILSAPCYADARAKLFAKSLSEPAVEIYDAAKLLPLVRRSGLRPPERRWTGSSLAALKAALCALPERRAWWKNVLFGLMLFPVYLLTGNVAYLFLAVGALFLGGAGWRMRRA